LVVGRAVRADGWRVSRALQRKEIAHAIQQNSCACTKSAFQNLAHGCLLESIAMSKPLVPDELWEIIQPLLPEERPRPKGGRPPVANRDVVRGIIFVLRSGIPWAMLPPELGCGSGVTCWRRVRDWNNCGVWRQLHRLRLDRLGEADKIDWSRACIDSFSVPAPKGALRPGRIRRIAANRARSAILWSNAKGSRWR
jgi:transposase